MPICYKAAAIGQSLTDGQEVHNISIYLSTWAKILDLCGLSCIENCLRELNNLVQFCSHLFTVNLVIITKGTIRGFFLEIKHYLSMKSMLPNCMSFIPLFFQC